MLHSICEDTTAIPITVTSWLHNDHILQVKSWLTVLFEESGDEWTANIAWLITVGLGVKKTRVVIMQSRTDYISPLLC